MQHMSGEQIAKELGLEYKGVWEITKGKVVGYIFQVPNGIGGIMPTELTLEATKKALNESKTRY